MKLRNLRIEQQPKLMIIPMIDIVFFLLFFFMMSPLSLIHQASLPITLPQAVSIQQDSEKHIAVTIAATGSIYLDQEEISAPLLATYISQKISETPRVTVLLRADKQIPYGTVVFVLDQLKMAGVQRISVAAEPYPR